VFAEGNIRASGARSAAVALPVHRVYESLRMDRLQSNAVTVQAIRELVQHRPAHPKLIPPKSDSNRK